jgi:heterotetrameric sarcosine oxidase delta subunit
MRTARAPRRICTDIVRLRCPYCGERDAEEFVTLGSIPGSRPDADVPGALAAFHDYVYLRENPLGPNAELWYHSAGCRSWLRVTRDTRTHEVLDVRMAVP